MLTQVMTNKFMDFYALAKHSPVKSKKQAAVLSVLIKEFENSLQDSKKKHKQVLVYLRLYFQSTLKIYLQIL